MRPALCPVLVGRDAEVGRLRAALAGALAGRGGTVLVAGEAGIGKSRLVRETVAGARERGSAVLTGRAVAGGADSVPAFRRGAGGGAAPGRAGGYRGARSVPAGAEPAGPAPQGGTR